MQQKFTIELFKRDKVKFIIIHKTLVNKDKTKAFMGISSKSKIKFYKDLEKDLIEYFNKEKAKLKILINIFDTQMIEDISLLVNHLEHAKKGIKNTKITISSKTNYIASIENALLYQYLPKNMTKDDLANCYCHVKKNQEVISYTQGSKGVDGLNIYGNYVKAKEIRSKKDLSFNVSKKLEITNSETKSVIIAKEDGILIFKNEEFDIKQNLSLNSLDFKYVRYFNVPLDIEDVSIDIKSKREFENAVYSGVTLKAHNINIQGDIDSNTTIIAVNLNCNGNIHHSAILRAKNAQLKILKGKLKADNAKIKTIENGLVVADIVEVGDIVGGEIRAKEIKIKSLHSNNTIKFSKLLEIDSVKGNNNNIHISMNADLGIKKDIKRYQEELLKVENDVLKNISPKDIPIIKEKYIQSKKKAKILESKIKESGSDVKKLQKSMLLNQNVLDALTRDINALKYKSDLISNLKKIDELLYQTKIILKNGFNGDNIVIYDYVHKKENMRVSPKELIKYVYLENEDNQDIIKLR